MLPPGNKPIETLIINGCESEPYVTGNYRLLLEKTEEILLGAIIIRKILGAKRCFFAFEERYQKAIQAVLSKKDDSRFKEISTIVLRSKYPQGEEVQLIKTVTGREVPLNGTSVDIGCIVCNAATALAIRDAILDGRPLYERVVTVSGPLIQSPRNLLVRIGTPIQSILEYCGIDYTKTKKIIAGGPMTGYAIADCDASIVKTITALLAFDTITPSLREYPCINCGNCVKVCPMYLVPTRIAQFVEKNKIEDAAKWDVRNCTLCGACAYVCPSRINLVHFLQLGKFLNQLPGNAV